MRFLWAVHPSQRTIGGRLPLKPATKNKNKHKTRKPMPRKEKLATLQKQVSDVLDINKAFMHENEALQKMCSEGQHTIAWQHNFIQQLHDRLRRRNNFYLAKIKDLEKTIAVLRGNMQSLAANCEHKRKHMERYARANDFFFETIVALRAVLLAEGFAVDDIKGLNTVLPQ